MQFLEASSLPIVNRRSKKKARNLEESSGASQQHSPSVNSYDYLQEPNDLIKTAKSFTSFELLDQTDQLEMQHLFRKLIITYEKKVLQTRQNISQ